MTMIWLAIVNMLIVLSAAQMMECIKMRYRKRGKKCAIRTGVGLSMLLFTGAAVANTFISNVVSITVQ